MLKSLKLICLLLSIIALLSSFKPARDEFTAAEQQQISIATPQLFARSKMFSVDFALLKSSEYSFPLPVGKARVVDNRELNISTTEGDAVKAMFDGVVRLSRHVSGYGNVVVIRHNNGFETVYALNAQNLVNVGQRVKAGQTVAIVGGQNGSIYLRFFIMVNGAPVNPETLIDVASHRLRRQTVVCRKSGNHVIVSVGSDDKNDSERASAHDVQAKKGGTTLNPDVEDDPFLQSSTFKLDLSAIDNQHWAYPLPGSHVISPYGGRRNHAGVDIKTKPNDPILAAFDGVVTRSGPYFGYGNVIIIKHAYGFETLYSHQSKNMVSVGDKVKAGQVIGLTGRTGRATTEHLHFEVHFKGHRFDPAIMFDHANKKLRATTLQLNKNGRLSKSASPKR